VSVALDSRHIVVVGAGIGGAATAIVCSRAGARVTHFESGPEPHAVSAGILLQPNGLAVLYGLDLDERLARRGARLSTLRVADAAGRTLLDVRVPHFADGLDHALVVRRSDLLAALIDLVVAEPAVTCRFGTEVMDVSVDGTVTHRGPGGTDTVAADLVVGADGAHSRVRKRSRVRAHVGRTFQYVRGLGAPVDVGSTLTEYWTDLGIFGVAPVDHGTYFYASMDASAIRSALHERDFSLFRAEWARVLPIAGEVLASVHRFEDVAINEVIRVDCERWAAGRIVLLGDAAHAMAPNLGQGGNSALVDATVLVWELVQSEEQQDALAHYETRRRAAVRLVQDTADRIAWLSDLTNPMLRWLRDGAVRHLGSWLVGELSLRLVEQTDPLWLRLVAANPRAEVMA
jgi:2-polyprenyl-6-methoxyphenol hydroxylase-like FAD-dependent oxidoreductase